MVVECGKYVKILTITSRVVTFAHFKFMIVKTNRKKNNNFFFDENLRPPLFTVENVFFFFFFVSFFFFRLFFSLRTSETNYLNEAYSFYAAIRGRAYYSRAAKEDR